MTKCKARKGDVVQIRPGTNGRFGGCLLSVGRALEDGVEGFIDSPGVGRYQISCLWADVEPVGRLVWSVHKLTES